MEEEEQRAETAASYPTAREPGEGIDSEHIPLCISPESLRRITHGERNDQEAKSGNEAMECVSYRPSQFTSGSPVDTNKEGEDCRLMLLEETVAVIPEQTTLSGDLFKENALLRSELCDVHEELQKRLEDLETQRRAEAETRTQLKQLSRQHASQAAEKEEQVKEWTAQLDRERAETERLRKALSTMETEIKRERDARENEQRGGHQPDGTTKALEDRESEMIQLNIQLKKQLAEVKVELALEREGRERDAEERKQMANSDRDVIMELNATVAQLKAELEGFQLSRSKSSLEEENLSASSPLTYLTLHDDEINSNFVSLDNNPPLSPEKQHLSCQSTNQRNMLDSQPGADVIKNETTLIDPECSQGSDYLGGSPLSDKTQDIFHFQKDESARFDFMKELEHLRDERERQTQRANQCQVKLEALQHQVGPSR